MSSTTRGINPTSLSSLSLFSLMLPSLARTVEPGFRYRVVIIHDVGDAFYEDDGTYAAIEDWFNSRIAHPLAAADIEVQLLMVSFTNTERKPGPAFNVMLRAAADFGAEWFYRINDDSEFVAPWAVDFTTTLLALGQPYGAVGPLCKQGNTDILTHDFVHRTHLDIFETYYPPALVDWWMDDWISRVYGASRTVKVNSAEIIHHTDNHGTRYQVDFANQPKLAEALEHGKKRIVAWMEEHDIEQDVIDAYNNDNFVHTVLGDDALAKMLPDSERPAACRKLASSHGVVPNQTWGTLSADDQVTWKVNDCDRFVN